MLIATSGEPQKLHSVLHNQIEQTGIISPCFDYNHDTNKYKKRTIKVKIGSIICIDVSRVVWSFASPEQCNCAESREIAGNGNKADRRVLQSPGALVRRLEALSMSSTAGRRAQLFPPGLHSNESQELQSSSCFSNLSTSCPGTPQHHQLGKMNGKASSVEVYVLSGRYYTSQHLRGDGSYVMPDAKTPSGIGPWLRDKGEEVRPRSTGRISTNGWSDCSRFEGLKNDKVPHAVLINESSSTNLYFTSEDSDLSDGEKGGTTTTPRWSGPVELQLRPEAFEGEVDSASYESEILDFAYPEFLPEPLRSLDLTEALLLLDCEEKSSLQHGALGPIVNRLIQMEKMQQATVRKERPRAGRSRPCTAAGSVRSALRLGRTSSAGSPTCLTTGSETALSHTCSELLHSRCQPPSTDCQQPHGSGAKRRSSIKRPKTACESTKNCRKKAQSKPRSAHLSQPGSSSAALCRNQMCSTKKPLRAGPGLQSSACPLRASRKFRRPKSSKRDCAHSPSTTKAMRLQRQNMALPQKHIDKYSSK
ncbi:uncharacterized protein LOC136771656 [Amia ocellicauda]|uniref:uncharacterized protein LOC136771656 n=1 Tax=Amia ocellicauda TaxID=2972642 RepID=UPI00346437FC